MAALSDIEGIGATYESKLQEAGLRRVDDLLAAGGTPAGRDELAASSIATRSTGLTS
jgi:hypothetical protein